MELSIFGVVGVILKEMKRIVGMNIEKKKEEKKHEIKKAVTKNEQNNDMMLTHVSK
jgi:hypothetical protein